MTNRLMIIKNGDLLGSTVDFKDKEWTVLRLKNPKDGEFTSYLFMESASKPGSYHCYELILSSGHDSFGSVFIDDYVQADYQVLLSHKYDLRYFFIALTMKANEVEEDFKSIGELKEKLCETLEIGSVKKGAEYERACHLIKNLRVDLTALATIFEIEDPEKKESKDADSVKIQLNLRKCLEWLKTKSEKLCKYMEDAAPKQAPSAKSQPDKSAQKHKLEAFELQSQYINKYLAGRLRKELELNLPLDSNENNSKRSKLQEV